MHDLYHKLSCGCDLLGCHHCPVSQIRSLKAISGPSYIWLNDENSDIEAPSKARPEARKLKAGLFGLSGLP